MFVTMSSGVRTAGIYIPLLTGTLSVIGSGSILYSIWARRSTKLKDPQHRILGMMSIFDVLYSLNKALTFLTYPSGIGVPTFGNDATCSLQGFFTQFAYATGSYNVVLSIYYYLIINKGMTKEEFAKVWEKVLHGIVVVCHLSFAIISASIGLYNPTPAFCYIAPGPYDCSTNPDVPCRFETSATYFYEAFGQGWIQLAYVVIIVTNLLIWLSVRRQEKLMKKYQTQLEASRLSDMEKQSSYARSVFIQSILYVGAFIVTWSSATIFHLVWWITGVSKPWITLLVNTLLPLQGFWNAFIYARPRYIRLKKMHGDFSFRQLITLVFLPQALPMSDREGGRRRSTFAISGINNFRSTLRLGRGSVRTAGSTVGKTQRPILAESNLNLVVVDEEQGKDVEENEADPGETEV